MESKGAVIAAFIANFFIAIAKYIAAFVSGSASMLAEAYHSTSDTLNQVALYRGIVVSTRKPSKRHEFGYGKAAYFWSFVVAIMIFGIAGALSFIEGIEKVRHPHVLDPGLAIWIYGTLAFAFAFETFALLISLRILRHRQKQMEAKSLWETMKRTKDAPLVTVVVEDSLALGGVLIAAIGVSATYLTGNGLWDGLASLAIGVLLMGIALVLARRNRDLILGEAMEPAYRLRAVEAIERHPRVQRLVSLSSMHIGADALLVALEVEFDDDLTTDQLETAVDEIEAAVIAVVPGVTKIFVEADAGVKHLEEEETISKTTGATTSEKTTVTRRPAKSAAAAGTKKGKADGKSKGKASRSP